MYVVDKVEPDTPPLYGGLLMMYNKMKSFARENKGKWVCVYDEQTDNSRLYDDWFLLANSYLRFEMHAFNWQPYKLKFEYGLHRRILVRYK